MPRDERELSLHWRTEASKAFRILDQLWQQPVPNWNGHYTSRDIRQAAHLCRGVMSLLGSDPDLVEEYAEELYLTEHGEAPWNEAPWSIHAVYRERARQELQSMTPPPVYKAENVLIQAEAANRMHQDQLELLARRKFEEDYPGTPWADAGDKVQSDYLAHFATDGLRPVRAEQHEQQEEFPPWTEEEKALARQLHDEEYPDRDFDRLKPKLKEEYLRKARLVLHSRSAREQPEGE